MSFGQVSQGWSFFVKSHQLNDHNDAVQRKEGRTCSEMWRRYILVPRICAGHTEISSLSGHRGVKRTAQSQKAQSLAIGPLKGL